MINMTPSVPKFPRNPVDGMQICDRYGNRWHYFADSDAWISKGLISSYDEVTESQDGLATPDIYEKLYNLKIFNDRIDLKSSFKILPGKDAYWYYFKSSDKLFRFIPEGESVLRIEVDKSRLFQILYKNRKQGKRGDTGDVGLTGPDGFSGPSICDKEVGEPCYKASAVNGNKLDFAIYTPTPLVLNGPVNLPNNHVPDISVRLFRINISDNVISDQIVSLSKVYADAKFGLTKSLLSQRSLGVKLDASICDIPLSPILKLSGDLPASPLVTIDINPLKPTEITITTASTFSIDIESTKATIKYDPTTGIVCGSVFLPSGSWNIDEWCIRSRQKGPDGDKGDAGECRIKIVEATVDDTNIQAVCPIINVRYNNSREVLHVLCANLLEDVCVDKLKILAKSNTVTSKEVTKSVFAAAQMILDDCKYVYRYKPEIQDFDIPDLNLLNWEPQPGCFTKRHYPKHEFDWIALTQNADCADDNTCCYVYPWNINKPSEPEKDECCQEDFFYCPNIQDGVCPPSPSGAAAAKVNHDNPKIGGRQLNSVKVGSRRWNVKS